MSGHLVVAELAAWVACVGLLAAGGLLGVAFHVLRGSVRRLAPATRERVLGAWAVAPWALAGLVVAGCFLPSLGDWAGVALDHCGSHSHHAHLCFHHAAGVERSAVAGALAGLVGLGLAGASVVALRSAWRYLNLVGGLVALGEPDEARDLLRVATRRPLALTLGIVAPRIFVSEGLEEQLSPSDLRAVIAHERGHVERRDGVRKLLHAALTLPYPPPARNALIEEHALVCELLCDARAAEEIGEPARVARALLSTTRLDRAWDAPLPAPACRFGPGRTSQRVRALLEPDWEGSGQGWLASFAGLGVGAGLLTGLLAGRLHHATETALSIVF